MNNLLVLPIVIPLATAACSFLLWRRTLAQRVLGIAGTAALLFAAIVLLLTVEQQDILVLHVGEWSAPFGITLVADIFSALMVLVSAIIGFAVSVYSLASIDHRREAFGYYPLLHILLMGVCGAFLTGDIFNLYVWFEVMLIASFVLLALGGERGQIEGALKYVTLNLMSSALFLMAVGVLYGMVGTLNMADLARKLDQVTEPGLITALAMLFLVAFGIKAALFPLFFWLPASYHTPPAPVSAIFAGLLTKVGVYALVRVFTLIFHQDTAFTHSLILVVAAATMVTGVLGALAQGEFRRILSFHIVSQIGYMTMGLGLFTPLALAGTVYYIVHHIIVKTNLFLLSGVARQLGGAYELKGLGGLYRLYPGLAFLFLIPALSLAGIPPLSGFFAKLALVRAGLAAQQYLVVFAALAVSLVTLLSMVKIWNEAFWKAAPEDGLQTARQGLGRGHVALIVPIVGLAALTVTIGLAAEPLFALSVRAAQQLLDPAAYVRAVLGG